ncbi:MAG TPA: TerC/Alx family metal homeostasis membrane protein [Oligoflexia bacterium]|nr:TerC/Alx family metal homeostasis membrane protein [Oligoflexia bacterium]HMP27204.1 TerC/Alx family metal homeostasis membrane protein [Oligoflexia bacterium]
MNSTDQQFNFVGQSQTIFPIIEFWWLYLIFITAILGLIAVDLYYLRRGARPNLKNALIYTVGWVSLALIFNVILYYLALWRFTAAPHLATELGLTPIEAARRVALEYLTGYIIEESLSVDNVFVFVVILNYFAVPPVYQHRVLLYGILGAIVFRGIFIALGSVVMKYHVVMILFGALLILTGAKLCFSSYEKINPEKNLAIKWLRRFVRIDPHYHKDYFFVRLNGVLHATPMLVALVALEVTDLIFAFDSVPAIFAITKEPFVVFSSNIFAILGLRALYFVLAGALHLLHLLKYGLSIILIFIGLKMVALDHLYGGKMPIEYSLSFVVLMLGLFTTLSLIFPKKKRQAPNG